MRVGAFKMTDDTPQPTGDPDNPWGYNRTPSETPTYQGQEIPVINEASSREDLLRYIRILEHRLDLTHVFTQRPEGMPAEAGNELGAPQSYDIPIQKRNRISSFDLVTITQNQAERAYLLSSEMDRVGIMEISEKLYRGAIHDEEGSD